MSKKIALITGANRGLGFGTSKALAQKGYTVIMAGRDLKKVEAAAAPLQKEKLDIITEELDVSKESSINACAERVLKKFGHIDVLVNNAGVFLDEYDAVEGSVFKTPSSLVREAWETNTIAPMLLMQKFIPGMVKNKFGRVVNISSGMGQLSEMNGGFTSYRLSKTALNALTRIFSDETEGTGVLVNSVCPGWVKTDMGGEGAERTIDEGIKGILWAATLPENGPSGGFFRDGEKIEW